jgi:hypothetical protein
MKKDEMGRTYNTHWEDDKYSFLLENFKYNNT